MGQNYRKMWIKSALKFLAYLTLSSVLLALTCRFQLLAPITVLLGLFLGWTLVTHGYIEIDGRMTVYGDLLLLGEGILVIALAAGLVPFMCDLLPQVDTCAGKTDRLTTACTFGVSFSVGISSFSLWLWFRIRQARFRSP